MLLVEVALKILVVLFDLAIVSQQIVAFAGVGVGQKLDEVVRYLRAAV